MKTLLHITSSLFGADGQSSRLAQAYVQRHQEHTPGGRLFTRDLSADPVPHLSAAAFAAGLKPASERSVEEQRLAALGDALIGEIEAADELVIGLPMYNFGVPSTLKAWFDHIARAGRTFRYTGNGPEGLLKGKRAIVFATRGGMHAGKESDSETGFVRTILGFLGISDVQFVYAEGLGMGESTRTQALAQAQARIEQQFATTALAA